MLKRPLGARSAPAPTTNMPDGWTRHRCGHIYHGDRYCCVTFAPFKGCPPREENTCATKSPNHDITVLSRLCPTCRGYFDDPRAEADQCGRVEMDEAMHALSDHVRQLPHELRRFAEMHGRRWR